jgi:hypothetical protein
MTGGQRQVATAADLLEAAENAEVRRIVVVGDLIDVPVLRLSPGQTLAGAGTASIRFAETQDGLQLSADNEVKNLQLTADPNCRALFNDTGIDALGRIRLDALRIHGVVRLVACDRVRSGHIEASEIDIVAADARGFDERPKGYGVEVVPGAFTLWNQQTDPAVTITADLVGLAAGRAGAPVRGSGIFISGAGDKAAG